MGGRLRRPDTCRVGGVRQVRPFGFSGVARTDPFVKRLKWLRVLHLVRGSAAAVRNDDGACGRAAPTMRVFIVTVLLVIAAICCFGFLATYEPVDGALGWRVGYGAGIVACLYGALRLLRGGGEER